MIVLSDYNTLERANSLESDLALGLEGPDLEDYLIDLASSSSSSRSSRDDLVVIWLVNEVMSWC